MFNLPSFANSAPIQQKARRLFVAIALLCGSLVTASSSSANSIIIGGMKIEIPPINIEITRKQPVVSQKTFINQALNTGQILPLISIIRYVEGNAGRGGKVLDAGLYTPNLNNPLTWYYYIKHRSIQGRVTARYFAASNGRELINNGRGFQ